MRPRRENYMTNADAARLRNLARCLLLVVTAAAASNAAAATLPAGFRETLVATGISSATAMQFAPDGRLFVCEQGGTLRVIKNGVLLPTPFVSLTVDSNGERGLLGVAFDPNFASNQFVYLYYTATTTTVHNRISRFIANGDVAVPASGVVLLDLPALGATNHNGGALNFGPDGKLYAAVGENAVASNSQSLSTPLGKILRINNDGTIPTDNPFYGNTTGNNRAIWALGLRNPFTFAFDNSGSRMFINDVGETMWEEIDDGIAGANYGWPVVEGPLPANQPYTYPRYWYDHSQNNGGCAITGGAFYNPPVSQFPPSYAGHYFFADLCRGWIRKLDPSTNQAVTFATGISLPVDLKGGTDGALYYLSRGSGSVVRVTSTTTADSVTPASGSGTVQTFALQVLGHHWRRQPGNARGVVRYHAGIVDRKLLLRVLRDVVEPRVPPERRGKSVDVRDPRQQYGHPEQPVRDSIGVDNSDRERHNVDAEPCSHVQRRVRWREDNVDACGKLQRHVERLAGERHVDGAGRGAAHRGRSDACERQRSESDVRAAVLR